MSQRTPLSTAGRVMVGGLAVAAASIFVQAVTGIGADFPTIPPGLVLLLVAIAVVVAVPRWWAPALGALPPLVLVVGAFLAPEAAEQLGDPGQAGAFVGTLVTLLGAAVAVVAGAAAVIENRRDRSGRRT